MLRLGRQISRDFKFSGWKREVKVARVSFLIDSKSKTRDLTLARVFLSLHSVLIPSIVLAWTQSDIFNS